MSAGHPDVPRIHEALVARLTADVRAVPRLWPPSVRLALWLTLAVAVVLVATSVGLRADLAAQAHRPLYLLELAAALGAGAAAAAAALQAGVPGGRGSGAARVALALGVAATVTVLYEPASSVAAPGASAGIRCAFCVAMFGSLPWAALFLALGRAAPLDGEVAGAFAGGAAFMVGAAAVRVACPIDGPLHLFGWHMMPVIVWSTLSAVAGRLWLERWRA